jgi:cytochrome c-type biogenesis protein CcmH
MRKRLFFPTLLFWVLLTVGAASAQSSTPVAVSDDQVNAVARELYCPECENIPLDACPSQACIDMRAEIRQKLEQGWTKAQIKQYYVERYGDRVVGAPPAHGWNWLMYVIPPAAILALAWIFYNSFRFRKRSSPIPDAQSLETQGPAAAVDDYVARLEAELKKAKNE